MKVIGHDIADEPHETTHEMVTECRGACGQKPPCSNCADVRIPVQWTRWPQVDALRSRPARENADYAAAIDLVRQMEAAEGDALGVAA